jgi:pseudaminic acid cytidylyltransferase
MISCAIEKALQSGLFFKVIVSTDSCAIAEVAIQYGAEVPLLRPADISNDQAGLFPVIERALQAIKQENYEFACCILATSPLIEISYLSRGYDRIRSGDFLYVLSASKFPYTVQRRFKESGDDVGLEVLFPDKFDARSQDSDEYMHDAGQFYWSLTQTWLQQPLRFDKRARLISIASWRVQDIATMEDWRRAELIH